MKKLILFLLLSITAVISLSAQTKSQVLVDIRRTMEDFMADLSMVNMDRINIEYNVSFIANTFGHTEYFIHNGKEVESFQKWLEKYCMLLIDGEPIQHSVTILEQSLSKVNPSQEADKRYKVDAIIRRERMYQGRQTTLPEDTLTFTFIWKGNQQYASIAEMDGQIRPLPMMDDTSIDAIGQTTSEKNRWTEAQMEELYRVALAYEGQKNYGDALNIYKQLAEQKHVKAQFKMGVFYQEGYGVDKNLEEAMKWYTMAANKGHSEAQFMAGTYLCMKAKTLFSLKSGQLYLVESAEQGNTRAMYYLAYFAEINRYYMLPSEIYDWYKKAAQDNYPDAIFKVGECWEKGIGTVVDKRTALDWYEKAAEEKHLGAMLKLAVHYEDEKKMKKAVKWYEKAAYAGDSDAMVKAGMFYMQGVGVKRDTFKAAAFFELAAKEGNVEGQYRLGSCYEYGMGVVKNLDTAMEWYRKAAEQGHETSKSLLKMKE